MKMEINIEEKAKRYDKAIERAEGLIDFCSDSELKTLEYVFPELKESEDERIRKDIISFVEQAIDAGYGIISKERKEKWIAWLEKQGRLMKALQISNARIGELIEKNYYLKEQLEKQGEHDMGISEATKQELEDSLNKALEKETSESCNEFLDEQGEQKHAEWHREDEQNLNACLGYIRDEFLRRWLTDIIHVKYYKPADNAEPKFHEGEWLINIEYGNVVRVLEVLEDNYKLDFGGDTIGKLCIKLVDKDYRLWTIQDAKDGDMIYVSTEKKGIQATFYKYEGGIIYFHCSLCRDFIEDGYMPIGDIEFVCPLQNVHYQRFFEKMKEAGYKWNAEKKELKKIELKPAEAEKGAKGNNSEIPILEPPLTIKHAREVMGIKQDTAWSEEDESNLDSAIYYIRREPYRESDVEPIVDWLRHLKGRVQPQQQEWSEGDEHNLNSVINLVHNTRDGAWGSCVGERIESWLKSLKDRYTWKPSDEQMKALNYCLENNIDKYGVFGSKVVGLYNDLRKLKA